MTTGAPARLVVLGALTATAAWAFSPLFAGTGHLPVVFAAAAVPFAVTALSVLAPRFPAALRVPLGLVGRSDRWTAAPAHGRPPARSHGP
jgi:hypothetical protein